MEWMIEQKRKVAGYELSLSGTKVGDDILLCVQGGEKPHIGCVVQAIPRASLSDKSKVSCTSSVMNLVGHKDEYICRMVAEKVCVNNSVAVVCTGGVHIDNISQDEIKELIQAAKEMAEDIKF